MTFARSFEIGGKRVGEDAPVFVIAEVSANHGGSIATALATIEAAAKVGVDAIKLQTYTPDTLTLRSSAPPFVVKTNNEWAGRTLHDLYAEAMTPWDWHAELKACAEAHGLVLFSTPFDPTATELLHGLDAPAYKIASFEIVDLPLVDHVARRGKPMILSTGMASLGEIEAALAVCKQAGNDRVALLRCVSSYPADPADMHLQSLRVLRELGVVIGLSDHTREDTVAIASVALGAKVVEKHFILDRSIGGPDAFFSLEPSELASLLKNVRATEAAMRPPRFGPSPREQASTSFRRSLFVAKDVAEGEVITCDHVRSVRPADGLHPRHLPEVLGARASTPLVAGTPLKWQMVTTRPPCTLSLRRAIADDAPRLLEWRNDPVTREMSVDGSAVANEAHVAWLKETLSSRDRALFVAEHEGRAVGQVRLDRATGNAWEVSLTVAPSERRRGFAREMLAALEPYARDTGANVLVARIKTINHSSTAAFKRAGYYAFVEREGYLHCERRVRPLP